MDRRILHKLLGALKVSSQSRLTSLLAVVVPLLAGIYCIYYFPHFPFGQYDSATYVGFGDSRPFGYALLLKGLFAVPGGIGLLVPLQFTLHFSGVIALATAFKGVSRYAVTVIVLAVLISLDEYDLLYDVNMLTDGIFFSLCLFAMACSIRMLSSPALVWPVALGLVMGAAVWFRAAALGLLLLPALTGVLALIQPSRRSVLRVTLLAGVSVLTIVGHVVVRGVVTNSFSHSETTALSPFATNAAFIMPRDLVTDYPELYAEVWLASQWAQEKFRAAQTPMDRVMVIVNNGRTVFDKLSAEVITPYVKAHPDRFGDLVPKLGVGTVSLRVVRHFSDATMMRDPIGFISIGWDKFLISARNGSLYPMQDYLFREFRSLYDVTTLPLAKFLTPYVPDAMERYEAMTHSPFFLNESFPRLFGITAKFYYFGWIGEFLRLFAVVFPVGVTVWAAVWCLHRKLVGRDIPTASAVILAAVPAAFTYDFLVAMVEMPLTRYFYPMKPLLLVSILIGLEAALVTAAPYISRIFNVLPGMMPSRKAVNAWALNGIVLALGCLVALGLGEVMFRIYNPLSDRLRGNTINFDRNLTRVIENNVSDKLDKVIYRTSNSIGFRGDNPPAFFDQKMTIVAVGGSTTECYYLTDGKTWPEQLGNLLKNKVPRVWVNNAGMDGHSTFGHFIMVRDYISKIRPKIILYLIGINDVELDTENPYDGAFDKAVKAASAGPEVISLGQVLRHPGVLLVYSAQYSRLAGAALNLRRAFRSMKAGLGHAPQSWDSAPAPDRRSPTEKAAIIEDNRTRFIPLYEQRLSALLRLTRDLGIEPVLITQPSLYGRFIDPTTGFDFGPATEVSADRLELYNDVTRRLGRQYRVPVVDLAARMPKDTQYFYDAFHYTNSGAAKVADLIAEDLIPILAQSFPDQVLAQ
ncbi:hypothetical protein CU669_11120 [Paramagnetospirillum kuznetsovii]|uniref:SGNH hydrolase-type esterase domain-containing protein n=1 Tax=Paramagnetospirillum kuznetsovii TaxID=2053833 RepID=A0A364NXN9_9PROT|nr:SGNH/GDSL hydrolase family protein [Paramagnetospirillum kuznetsovii]RAU21849.1 hypothetical protein CU669_11120 [Paramagnetospirillum kuznetsovii]